MSCEMYNIKKFVQFSFVMMNSQTTEVEKIGGEREEDWP
jgi:hypothetical protein